MNVQELPIESIDAGDRLRSIDMDYVAFLAKSIEEHGLRQPIEVRKIGRSSKYALISGGHRLKAVSVLGHESIVANIVVANDLQAALLEIDENLFRRELSPLDRATFLARRKEVYEELHPETKHGGDRRSDQVDKLGHLIQSFSEVTAEKLGISERTVRRAVHLFQGIAPDVRQRIAGTWLAESGSQLDALAKLTPDDQRKIAEFVLQWPGVRQVSEIARQLAGRPKPDVAGRLEKFLAFWRKCDPEEQQQIVEHAAAQMPSVAFEAAWEKGSAYQRETIIDFMSPKLPGFQRKEAA